MNNQSLLKKNTTFLLIGTFLNKGVQFLVIPFFSKWLSAESYGRFDLLYTYVSLLIPIITLSTQEAIFRFSIDEPDINKKKSYITNGFVIDLINFFVVTMILGVVIEYESITIWGCFLAYLFAELFSTYLRGYLRAIGRLDIYSFAMAISTVFLTVLVTIFVYFLRWGLEGILLGYAIGTFIGDVILCVWSNWGTMIEWSSISIKKMKELIKYSVSLVPNDLSWWVMNASDRQIINIFFGDIANGVYAIAHKIPALCAVIFNMFSVSWQQEIVLKIDDANRNAYMNEVYEKMLIFLCTICSGLLAVSYVLYYFIFDFKYFEGILYSPILIVAAVLTAISQFLGGIQIALKQPKQNGITTVIGAIANVLLHLTLIHYIGLYAASISTLIANGIIVLLRIKLLKNIFVIQLRKKTIIAFMGLVYFFIMSYIHKNMMINTINILLASILFVSMNKDILNGFYLRVKGVKNKHL